jgi:hypothetical protein
MKENGQVRKAVLYAEDTALTRRIVDKFEADPSWELIALCSTLADLNFILDRVTVDILLLQLTPETGESVFRAVWERTGYAHLLVGAHSRIRRPFPAPSDLVLVERKLQSMRRGAEGGFWAFLSPTPESRPACRTAKDLMGAEAYRWFDRIELRDDDSRCNTVA